MMLTATTTRAVPAARPRGRRASRPRSTSRASARRGDTSTPAADDDGSRPSTDRRVFVLSAIAATLAPPFASVPRAVALPAEAKPMSAVDAYVTLMDGRDAIASAMALRGTEGGKRQRVYNLLPRYADKARTMTAALPAAVVASYGAVVQPDDPAGGAPGAPGEGPFVGVPESKMGAMEEVLIGAKNVVALAAFVAEDRPFTDDDIPQETFESAIAAIDAILGDGDGETVRKASAERCRRLLAGARDMDEMRTFASSPACNAL